MGTILLLEMVVGNGLKEPQSSEMDNLPIARKSLVAASDIRQGDLFSERNLTAKRPGTGISPMAYWDMLGVQAERNYRKDEVVN